MKCRQCNSKHTRVTCTQHQGHQTIRYCRCLDCSARYKTIETYESLKRGSPPGSPIHPNHIKRGEENNLSVLTESNVLRIRDLAKQHVTYKAIAKEYGIHKDTVYKIVKRKTWSHV